MCIDTVSLPNVSRYDDISIYRCISSMSTQTALNMYHLLKASAVKNVFLQKMFALKKIYIT